MRVAIVPVTPFQQNCSILVDEATGKAAVVDPGGDTVSFGEERESNPFVSDRALR